MKIVNVAVIDLTRPVEQKGFKSVVLFDTTQAIETKVITDTSDLSGTDSALYKTASAYFSNGGSTLIVAGKVIANAGEIGTALADVDKVNPFYGVIAIFGESKQSEYVEAIKTYVGGTEKLAVVEMNGDAGNIISGTSNLNSDRIVVFANSASAQTGIAGAVSGVCFPQDEGSITWGNKAVVDVAVSGFTGSEEVLLNKSNINYITEEKGLIITQFGKTTSGSNADITRSKDFLKNRIEEALTSALVNNKKIPFTTAGMAMISSSLNEVGVQAVNQGMLDTFVVITPSVSDIPTNDKANRVLRNVVFRATLSGAVETIELNLEVRL